MNVNDFIVFIFKSLNARFADESYKKNKITYTKISGVLQNKIISQIIHLIMWILLSQYSKNK